MRRIFFKPAVEGQRQRSRRIVLAVFFLAGIAGGGTLGYLASGLLFANPAEEKPAKLTEILVEKVSINVMGRGTLIFDARIGLTAKNAHIPDRQILRDTVLSLTTSAGALPIVRQSEKVIPAINQAIAVMVEGTDFTSLSIENAALYLSGM
nr:hypothetical protein [Amylibacter sp.]